MVRIELETRIAAPIERCFDLASSIDLHIQSTSGTGEQAIAGRTSGLIGLGETVTWQGRHFGVLLTHTSKIVGYERPTYFKDVMVQGIFARFEHEHRFTESKDSTVMIDLMEFDAPAALLGRVVEKLVLQWYLRRFLEARNRYVKQVAESGQWKQFV